MLLERLLCLCRAYPAKGPGSMAAHYLLRVCGKSLPEVGDIGRIAIVAQGYGGIALYIFFIHEHEIKKCVAEQLLIPLLRNIHQPCDIGIDKLFRIVYCGLHG